jgi:hypothetical protein
MTFTRTSIFSFLLALGFIGGVVLVLFPGTIFAQEATLEADMDVRIFEGEVTTTTLEQARLVATSTSLLNLRPDGGVGLLPPTTPSEAEERQAAVRALFEGRPVNEFKIWSVFAYWVQQAALMGIPTSTIVLILLTPIIAVLVSFIRIVVGLPTLELFVPIALAYALVAVGIALGLIVLAAVIFASYIAKVFLKNLNTMFFPKRSLSMLFLSLFVFAALTVAVFFELGTVRNVSIFPILILMLLGDSIVSIQLHKSFMETFSITAMTILIGLMGYWLATSVSFQQTLLLYPEVILLTIPANILIGRYFGLRLTEIVRFKALG